MSESPQPPPPPPPPRSPPRSPTPPQRSPSPPSRSPTPPPPQPPQSPERSLLPRPPLPQPLPPRPAHATVYTQVYHVIMTNMIRRNSQIIIDLIVTSDPEVVDEWVPVLYNVRSPLVVGIGFHWAFQHVTTTGASTLTLCVGQTCLIYHLSHTPYVPPSLTDFLNSPSTLLYGIWTSFTEIFTLSTSHRNPLHFRELINDPLFTIRSRVTGRPFFRADLSEIASDFLGAQYFPYDSSLYFTNWDDLPLSSDQIIHAFLRPYLSLLIGLRLN